MEVPKSLITEKSIGDQQTFAELSLAHGSLHQTVSENHDLGRVLRPYGVHCVLTASVKILPFRPPARLINKSRVR